MPNNPPPPKLAEPSGGGGGVRGSYSAAANQLLSSIALLQGLMNNIVQPHLTPPQKDRAWGGGFNQTQQ